MPEGQPANPILFNGAPFWAGSFEIEAPLLGLVAATPACVPSATIACLYNRFKIAVTYGARPASGL